ncbi:phosphoribosylglycinamide formyltransferase [Phenylobacterium sp.]|uniref:phosphoribosylglycinamide formyltransferase n=1 Tax=Phenylobacterium sp. TaxID=1871053 RepID=UPI0019B15801|nr:phosphoribosylglycinamide formyltransferase [Phenylobacterium sp.]MBC7169028.1 phosphoribosylglycinamide formyltransferase [Phenylobacterium sp.]
MLRLGFLASRNGTAMRAILEAVARGELAAEPRIVVSNNRQAPALAHAAALGVPTAWIPTKDDPAAADVALTQAMSAAGVELVVLSGYLRKLGPVFLERFRGRVLNIHPGPLPAFGGQGMYGRRVHEAVIASGVAESGAVIHLVDGEYDQGPEIARISAPVLPGDTAETLEARITALEPDFYVRTLQEIAEGRRRLPVV